MRKLILFGLGGIITLSLKSLFSFLFFDFFKLSLSISYSFTLLLIIFFSFFYNYYITFKNKSKFYVKLTKYLVSVGFFYLFDYLLVLFLFDLLSIHYIFVIILVTFFIFTLKYLLFNLFIFKEENINN